MADRGKPAAVGDGRLALTIVDPPPIDGMALKFYDLHTIFHVMNDYTSSYIANIEREHQRCGKALEFMAPLPAEAQALENLTRIMLSAFLSSYESVVYYLRESLVGGEERKWLKKRRATTPTLDAFDRLRNMDVHHEPLHSLIGLRFQVFAVEAIPSLVESEMGHAHWSLGHEGIGFNLEALGGKSAFTGHPNLIKLLTDKPILTLVHDCIHSVAELLNEAISRGPIRPGSHPFVCHACPQGDSTSSAAGAISRKTTNPKNEEILKADGSRP